ASRSTGAQRNNTPNTSKPRPAGNTYRNTDNSSYTAQRTTQGSSTSTQRSTPSGQTAAGSRPAPPQRTGRAQPGQGSGASQSRSPQNRPPQNRPPQSATVGQTMHPPAQRPAQQTGNTTTAGRP